MSKLTRRAFVEATTLAAASAALAACVPPAAPAPTTEVPAQASEAAPAPGQIIGEITITRGEHPSQPIVPDAPAHLATTEATGIRMNWQPVPSADYPGKLRVWLATKQVPDLTRATVADVRDFADPSVLQPLMPLLDKYGPNLKRYMEANPEVNRWLINGEHYLIPVLHYNWERSAPMPCIRKDLLDKAGLSAPEDFDQLHETLAELKKANPDAIGWTNRNGIKRLLMLISYPMGSGLGGWFKGRDVPYFDKDVDGGKWLYGPIHPEFKEVLAYFARMYEEDILDPDIATTTSEQWHERNSSKALFTWDNYGFATRWNTAFRTADPSITTGPWDVLPTIKGPKGPRQNDFANFEGGWCVSAACKNPEWVIKVLDWQITPIGLDITNWGIEGVHYTLKGPRPDKIEDYTLPGVNKVMPNAYRELLPAIVEKYKNEPQPGYNFMSETGTGLLDLTVLACSGIGRVWEVPGQREAWIATAEADPGLHREVLMPPFDAAEIEQLKKLQTDVNNIMDPALEKVVLGQMTLADYDKEVAAAIKAGAQDIERIYNEAEARLAQ